MELETAACMDSAWENLPASSLIAQVGQSRLLPFEKGKSLPGAGGDCARQLWPSPSVRKQAAALNFPVGLKSFSQVMGHLSTVWQM